MNYAQWVYDFGIIQLGERFGINPVQETIRRAPKGRYLAPSDAARLWVKHNTPLSQKEAYIENFKASDEFQFWLEMPDDECEDFLPEMLDLQDFKK